MLLKNSVYNRTITLSSAKTLFLKIGVKNTGKSEKNVKNSNVIKCFDLESGLGSYIEFAILKSPYFNLKFMTLALA